MSKPSDRQVLRSVGRRLRDMCNEASPLTEKFKVLYGEDIEEELEFLEGLADEAAELARF